VRAIEACSCSCCSAPSDRNRSDDRSPALRMHAVALRDAPVEHSPNVDSQGDFGGILVGQRVGGELRYRGTVVR